jgi:GNAT superfamily N-acetyltransferase
MKVSGVAWRTLTGYDMQAVETIAAQVHPAFYEAPEVLAERQQLYHNGTYLLEVGERPAGYVLSHPWIFGDLPPLNALLGALPAAASTYYIHDLALLPVARRIGAASYIINALAKHARACQFATMSLVAVNGSQSFWERHDFHPVAAPHLADKLLSYEPDAKLLVRQL